MMNSEPMSGLPADMDPDHVPEAMVQNLRSAARGDPDEWRHPDLLDGEIKWIDDPEAIGMVALPPEIYKHAHAFMGAVFGENNYTPDSVGQLVDVFVPCLRIMNDQKGHPWPIDGALWRRGGLGPVMIFARAKFMRYWYRTWGQGKRHDDSGYDCINFLGFTLRAEPEDKWGELGEPFRQ